VHRDVKPGNVLLRRDGVTKLVDLGIATAQDHTRLTHSGMVLGTAAYMAPEQLEGDETTRATDIYALGVVAYEALTGERAREGRTPLELAHRIATSPPPDLRDALPDASPQAAEVLKRAMARDPRDRPASAGELASGLARALEEPPTAPTRAVPPTRMAPRAVPVPAPAPAATPAAAKPPPPTAPPRRPGPTPGKRPVGAIALALVFLVLAAAVVIAAVLSSGDGGGEPQQADRGRQQQSDGARQQSDGQEQQQPQAEQQPAEPTPAPAEEPAPQEETGSFDPARGAQLNEDGFALMQQGDYAGAVPILQDAVASWPEDSQDINYAYALFNLGKSLNRSGNPQEAIPYLEKRLGWNDQRETVEAELALARRNAGGGGGGDD
jgi:eukaryotic-like serine/threonine-protein kinase